MAYELRPVRPGEVEDALHMALEVFTLFDAPDYPFGCVEDFKRNMAENAGFKLRCQQGRIPLFGAFDGNNIVCLIGLEENRKHISLVFTRRDYHRRGIATALMRMVLKWLRAESPALRAVTLTAAPYGQSFYRQFGFQERMGSGRRTRPMWYDLEKEEKADTGRPL